MGLNYHGLDMEIEEDLNPAKISGEQTDAWVGYHGMWVTIEADTDADDEPLDQ